MKAVVVADIHGDLKTLQQLVKYMDDAGLTDIIILGDFSRDYKNSDINKADIKAVLRLLRGKKVYSILGNCDHTENLGILKVEDASIENVAVKRDGYCFIGLGGSNETPFKTPNEKSEEDIKDDLNELYNLCDKNLPLIVLTHNPPKNTLCDDIGGGKHVGSISLRRFIEDKKPVFVLCSHIHECGGLSDKIGDTEIINAGMLSKGYAYVLDTDSAILVKKFP